MKIFIPWRGNEGDDNYLGPFAPGCRWLLLAILGMIILWVWVVYVLFVKDGPLYL